MKEEENSQQIWSPNVPIEWVKTRNLAFLSRKNQNLVFRSMFAYLEESSTSITCEDAVMFARRMILAHSAGNIVQDTA